MTGEVGTGWAAVPRYVARLRTQQRIGGRTEAIEQIAAEIRAETGTGFDAVYRAHLLEVLAAMRAAQDADLELLQALDQPDPVPDRHPGPLVRHRWQPRSTYNGEDDHVRPEQWGDG